MKQGSIGTGTGMGGRGTGGGTRSRIWRTSAARSQADSHRGPGLPHWGHALTLADLDARLESGATIELLEDGAGDDAAILAVVRTDGRGDFVSRRGAEIATVVALVDDGLSAARERGDGRHHPYTARMADSPTVWCPSCGAEYVAGSLQCADCRVALVSDQPAGLANVGPLDDENLVELGAFPRLAAQILRRRLETAGITVMVEWTSASGDASGTLIVPEAQADFAEAVVNEIDVDDEVPDTSPVAYVTRIEEHLAAAAGLLEELRTRLEQDELEG